MRALPSGEITRLLRTAGALGAANPLLRGLRDTLPTAVPATRSRASVKRLISASMWEIISSIVIALKCISTYGNCGGKARQFSAGPKPVRGRVGRPLTGDRIATRQFPL